MFLGTISSGLNRHFTARAVLRRALPGSRRKKGEWLWEPFSSVWAGMRQAILMTILPTWLLLSMKSRAAGS